VFKVIERQRRVSSIVAADVLGPDESEGGERHAVLGGRREAVREGKTLPF